MNHLGLAVRGRHLRSGAFTCPRIVLFTKGVRHFHNVVSPFSPDDGAASSLNQSRKTNAESDVIVSSCTAPAGISMCGHRLTRATALALSDKSLFAIARPWERMWDVYKTQGGMKAECVT